jgi:hypothetical protein
MKKPLGEGGLGDLGREILPLKLAVSVAIFSSAAATVPGRTAEIEGANSRP